jgi:hypothetical protein
MKVTVTEDTRVLIPNQEHKNFTDSREVVKKDTILDGDEKLIQGKRRGEDFVYRLFSFKDSADNKYKLIYIKKTKPMETTEVTLGADSAVSDTIVKIPSAKALFTKNVVLGTLIGAGAGFGVAKYRKVEEKKKLIMYTIGGAVVGFAIAKYMEKRKAISVKAAK